MKTIPEPHGEITRLPKWAREHIGHLETALSNAEAELIRVSRQHPGSNVMLDGKVGYPAVTLPANASVQFYLGEGPYQDDLNDLIEIHHERNQASSFPHSLNVSAYSSGRLIVAPRSGNGVNLMIGSY